MSESKKKKIYLFLVFTLSALIFTCLPVKDAPAKTIIDPHIVPCEINIILNKQFYVKGSVSISRWINSLNDAITRAQERLNNATTDAARNKARKDVIFLTRRRQSLTDIIMFNTPISIDDLRRLAADWKAQIERKWNLPNYRYDCCKVVVTVNVLVRREEDPPEPGYDQIGVVSGNFRPFIKGLKNFDANGFSNTAYREDLTGVWSTDMIENYSAPHEAAHEMGLNDQYEDPPDGGPGRAKPGRENDLLGGNGDYTEEQLSNLKVVVVSPTGEVLVDNIKTILRGRFIRCERQCCGPSRIPGSLRPTGGVAIDTSRRPRETDPYREGETASISREPAPAAPKTTDTQPTGPSIETAKQTETGPSTETGKPTETDTSATPGPSGETIQYRQVKVNDVTSDTGVLIKDTPAGSEVEISSLPTGKGANFRNWEVDKITLNLDGKRIRPSTCENFYVAKESIFKGAATAVFVALGSQYKGYAHKAESGEVCPVTGEKKAGSDVEEDSISEGINRTGMAAGLGLLVSQAKGQITGRKCTFKLNKEQAKKLKDKKGEARIDLINEDANLQEKIDLPIK